MRPAVTTADKKRAKREEKKREAEERAKMLRKERIMREIELGALNTKRYRTLWREMMMRIKMPQIAEDVEIACRNFDRALDIKDYRISFLMDALDEAEEQYQRNVWSHIEIIDQLLETYRKRVQREERNYQRTLSETVNQANTEISKIDRQSNEDETLMESITRGVERKGEESLDNIKSITLSNVINPVNYYIIFPNSILNILTSFSTLIGRCNVISETKNRRKCYETIKEKDEKDQQVIAQQVMRTGNLCEEIRKLRGKITMYDATAKKNISEIRIEYDFFENAYWTMKNRLLSGEQPSSQSLGSFSHNVSAKINVTNDFLLKKMQNDRSEQTKDQDQLKILTIEYNKTIKHLERLVPKGKRLLTLMQICRKYETEKEKVIPFDYCMEVKNSLIPSSQQIMEDYQDLTNFWRRVGAAQISTMQLRSEKDNLRSEANRLREYLHSYMTQKVRG
ncbi:dynein regulatory complex subunit 2 [Harpegnathos saltator]|uniref:dynein regulatory complex subunit 2 n=1 Tax=Harpegnathos saltator TaxID=610380 RepID=UPI000DBEDF63|nr:dynein regulatory complex subunit 2 [Harpegnathos saltator]